MPLLTGAEWVFSYASSIEMGTTRGPAHRFVYAHEYEDDPHRRDHARPNGMGGDAREVRTRAGPVVVRARAAISLIGAFGQRLEILHCRCSFARAKRSEVLPFVPESPGRRH
jgi:hypothetical protein